MSELVKPYGQITIYIPQTVSQGLAIGAWLIGLRESQDLFREKDLQEK